MSDRADCVEMKGGAAHLPAEFREVARLANRAGLDGFEVADVECGLDEKAILAIAEAFPDQLKKIGTVELPWPESRILITYSKTDISLQVNAARGPDLREALAESLRLQAHYGTLLNQWDCGNRTIFHSVDEWLANLERLREEKAEASG